MSENIFWQDEAAKESSKLGKPGLSAIILVALAIIAFMTGRLVLPILTLILLIICGGRGSYKISAQR